MDTLENEPLQINNVPDDGEQGPEPNTGGVAIVLKPEPSTLPYDPMTHDARLQVHLDEYSKCIVWCIKAGPEYHPAFDHKHKAPCNMEIFYFGCRMAVSTPPSSNYQTY